MCKTLSELTIKLKNDLINATDNNFNDENLWLSIENIHKIRMGVDRLLIKKIYYFLKLVLILVLYIHTFTIHMRQNIMNIIFLYQR